MAIVLGALYQQLIEKKWQNAEYICRILVELSNLFVVCVEFFVI